MSVAVLGAENRCKIFNEKSSTKSKKLCYYNKLTGDWRFFSLMDRGRHGSKYHIIMNSSVTRY